MGALLTVPGVSGTRIGAGESQGREVSEFQRRRILDAFAQVVAEQGLQGASVSKVVAGAGVSRRTYYQIFRDREDGFRALLEDALASLVPRMAAAYRSNKRWVDGVRASLHELLAFLDADPTIARCLVQSADGDEITQRRREQALEKLAAMLAHGRGETRGRTEPPPLVEEAVVHAVAAILRRRLLVSDCESLRELLGPLMSVIVLPYLGPAAARRELGRPAPDMPRAPAPAPPWPDRRASFRITYRTMRVLEAIAERPGESNRAIATAAGIGDEAQISRLLSRLESHGLIVKARSERIGQGANEWRLTRTGVELRRRIGAPHD